MSSPDPLSRNARVLDPATPVIVRMQHVHKRFGAVQANKDVSLEVRQGSIHALVGENGAGKSTLMSILYGFYAADEGEIEVEGKKLDIRNPQDAIAHGIGMVHQHFMLVDTLTALENIMLGAEPSPWISKAARISRERLNELMQRTGLQVDLDKTVGELPVGEQQRLEIIKTLFRGARILILDEPTAVLTPQEIAQTFEVLRRLADQGTTIIIITHKLKEVMALCDQVTVMRQGAVVFESAIAETSQEALAEAMVGRAVHLGRQERTAAEQGPVLLQAEMLDFKDRQGVPRLRKVSLTLRAGEIVGVAGVSGNGQSELLEVLSGLRQPNSGTLDLMGQSFAVGRWLDPHKARDLGMAHVPEDRYARAMVMAFGAWESAVLGHEGQPHYSHAGRMLHPRMMSATKEMMEAFDVRPRDPNLRSAKFSGGNQQKLVMAREIRQEPKVLLVGQPTRGVDIGAIEFIHGQLRALRDHGCAVLLVSSELDEILALSDRVIVMNQGGITGELPIHECTETRLGLLMAEGVPA